MNWVGTLVQRHVSQNDTVLDLGCGIMQATLDVVSEYPSTRLQCESIVGVDIYHKYLEFLKHKKNISVLRANVSVTLPFQDKSFDVVLLLDVVEHLSYDAALNLMGEAERVAKKKVIVLTPRNFRPNEGATKDVYPYTGLGENPYQQHNCLITPECLREQGFKTHFPPKTSKRYIYTFAVKRLNLRILHVWDQAGVAAVLAKHQKRFGHDTLVVKRNGFDGLGIDRFYKTYLIPRKLEPCSKHVHKHLRKIPSSIKTKIKGVLWKIMEQHKTLKFYVAVRRLAKHYDILHIHSVYRVHFFTFGKRKVFEFHGDDARKQPSFQNPINRLLIRLFLTVFQLRHRFYVSTPDLQKDVPNNMWVPNPVDVEHFKPRESFTPNTALYTSNWYESSERAKTFAEQHGWKLTDLDRASNIVERLIPYKDMPAFLSQFEFFIDRHRIKSLSKTALEASALGLKVVRWDNQIVEDLPEEHNPEKVAKRWIEIYEQVLNQQ